MLAWLPPPSPLRSISGQQPILGQPPPYPLVRIREDYRRQYGRALHIAPLGFANLVEFLQWGVFEPVVVVEKAQQKGEKG